MGEGKDGLAGVIKVGSVCWEWVMVAECCI